MRNVLVYNLFFSLRDEWFCHDYETSFQEFENMTFFIFIERQLHQAEIVYLMIFL